MKSRESKYQDLMLKTNNSDIKTKILKRSQTTKTQDSRVGKSWASIIEFKSCTDGIVKPSN